MNSMQNYRDNLLKLLKKRENFETYYNIELKPLSFSSQANDMRSLKQFFMVVNKPVLKLEVGDIESYLISEKFNKLKNNSKNQYIIAIKKYLNFYKRTDLFQYFKRYRVRDQELNKNDLINRSDLSKILKICDARKRAMIMINYEGALRRKEVCGILFKDIVYDDITGLVNLYVRQSKSKNRNIPLKESAPFIKEYFSMNDFAPNDQIFEFSINSLTMIYRRIGMKAGITKRLYPHILRHSRLTELAKQKVNEPQLRKFAGWSKKSPMAERYVHLNDDDLKDIIFGAPKQTTVKIEDPMITMMSTKYKEIENLKNDIKMLANFITNNSYDEDPKLAELIKNLSK